MMKEKKLFTRSAEIIHFVKNTFMSFLETVIYYKNKLREKNLENKWKTKQLGKLNQE